MLVDPASWSLAYDAPLADALARAGCEVSLHCTRSPHAASAPLELATLHEDFYRQRLRPLPRRLSRALQHPRDLHRVARRARREQADIVHVQWLVAGRHDARAWARLARAGEGGRGPRVCFTAHNAQDREEAVDPALLRGFDAVVAHTEGGERALRAAGLERVWRLPIGAYDAYATMPDPPELPVELEDDGPVAVMAGLLRPYKGVDVLLAAWPAVRARVPGAQLVVAGRPMGVDLPAPDELPAGMQLLPRFVAEDEYAWLLRRADCCVRPYRHVDGSGVAATALACRTPVVASDVGGFRELAGRGARLAEPGSAEALADALVEVLSSPGRRRELAAEAGRAVEAHYSWDAIAAAYVERYESLLTGS